MPSASLQATDKIEGVFEKETLKELGKASLTIAVAWVVFGIIQPVFSGNFSLSSGLTAILGFLSFLGVGVILLNRGSRRDD